MRAAAYAPRAASAADAISLAYAAATLSSDAFAYAPLFLHRLQRRLIRAAADAATSGRYYYIFSYAPRASAIDVDVALMPRHADATLTPLIFTRRCFSAATPYVCRDAQLARAALLMRCIHVDALFTADVDISLLPLLRVDTLRDIMSARAML